MRRVTKAPGTISIAASARAASPSGGGAASRPGATAALRGDLLEPALQLPELAVQLPEAWAHRRLQRPGDDRLECTCDIRSSRHGPPSMCPRLKRRGFHAGRPREAYHPFPRESTRPIETRQE